MHLALKPGYIGYFCFCLSLEPTVVVCSVADCSRSFKLRLFSVIDVKISFLIIDDDDDDIDLFREALREVDASVECWAEQNAQRALDTLQSGLSQMPTAIFLDVNMPVVTGWEVLQRLKIGERTREVPVIMYSTSSLKRDIEKAREMGAMRFMIKPSLFSALKNELQSVLRQIKDNFLHKGR